jgi:hypothetical protein
VDWVWSLSPATSYRVQTFTVNEESDDAPSQRHGDFFGHTIEVAR